MSKRIQQLMNLIDGINKWNCYENEYELQSQLFISDESQKSPNKSDTIIVIPVTPNYNITIGHEEGLINDDEIDNNFNARKIRISVKSDTVDYRKYKQFKRNAGQEYITNKDDDLCEKLFASYWSINNFNRRAAYISSCIHFTDSKTTIKRRSTPEKQKNRNKTFHYVVPKDGNSISVCKSCFFKIFGETKKFVSNVCTQKLSSPISKISPDKRGKPSNLRKPLLPKRDKKKILTTILHSTCCLGITNISKPLKLQLIKRFMENILEYLD
ncbi:hypothetical protein QTP88_028045 [Uroleucon formosanum]